jgi:hypothetical protein
MPFNGGGATTLNAEANLMFTAVRRLPIRVKSPFLPPRSRPIRVRQRSGILGVILAAMASLAALLPCDWSAVQAPSNHAAGNNEDTKESAIRLVEMRERAAEFKASTGSEEGHELVLGREPILRFSDPTRVAADGTIWLWCDKDRPIAIVTVERYASFWSYELVSMTEGRIVVARPDGLQWRPTEPGIQLQPMLEAEPPADNASGRLRQMRDLARRFALSETYRENTNELRLLPNPVHRFSDVEQGLVDGALFVFSYGTNPEAVLMIEGRGSAKGDAGWKAGFVRLTAAEVRAKLGDKTVWTERQQLQTPHDAPYTHFQVSRASD